MAMDTTHIALGDALAAAMIDKLPDTDRPSAAGFRVHTQKPMPIKAVRHAERKLEELLGPIAAAMPKGRDVAVAIEVDDRCDGTGFLMLELRDLSTMRRATPCKNPACDRLVAYVVDYCCKGCSDAHEGGYRVHEKGEPLGHTARCDERQPVALDPPSVPPPDTLFDLGEPEELPVFSAKDRARARARDRARRERGE